MTTLRLRLLLLLFAGVLPAPAQTPTETSTRAAIVGYSSNIEAFPFYRVRFRTTRGSATSEADAKIGKGVREEPGEALFVRDGDRATLELFGAARPPAFTAAEVKASKGGLMFTELRGFESEKYLRNAKSNGSYVAFLQTLQVQREESSGTLTPFKADVSSPLYTWYGDLGFHGPDHFLAQPGKYKPTFLGEKTSEGRTLVGVRFDFLTLSMSTWFDPAHGHLPVKYIKTHEGKVSYEGTVTEVKEFRPGRFFPMRRIAWSEEPTPGRWKFTETVVTELDVETRPSGKDFSTVFPTGTAVRSDDHQGYFKLKQDEALSPSDLDELFDKLDKSVANPRQDTAIEHTADRPKWWVRAAAVGGVVLLALLIRR